MNMSHLNMDELAKLIPEGETLPRVTEETVPFWCIKAEDGDAEARYQVAKYLIEAFPEEWPEDIERYLTLAVKSESGHGLACLELAKWKLRANPKGEPEVINLLENAESDGVFEATELLSVCYAKGIGVEQDLAEAEKCYERAARNGDGEAKLTLALRYKTGDCVQASRVKALYWLSEAEKAGVADAAQRFKAEEGLS